METVSLFGSTLKETFSALKNYISGYRAEITIISTDKDINAQTLTAEEIVELLDTLNPTTKLSATTKINIKEEKLSTTQKRNLVSKEAIKIKESITTPNDIFENRLKVIMRIVVTLILLGISVYLLVTGATESKTLPCSIISAVTGYWLK